MLINRHGEDIEIWAYVISGAIVLVSLFVAIPFCRWFCPLAAVLNPFSRVGLTRVHRDTQACVNCGLCAKACPMAIPVDRVAQVTHARCISCLDCVEACPKTRNGALWWGAPRKLGGRWPQAALVGLVVATLGVAVAGSYAVPLPSYVKERGEPPARTATLELKVHELSCRGRATLLTFYLERDDDLAIPGYVRLEAWPGPGAAPVRIIYDPARADPDLIRQAIVEPYFNFADGAWYTPTFRIEGYDPLALE